MYHKITIIVVSKGNLHIYVFTQYLPHEFLTTKPKAEIEQELEALEEGAKIVVAQPCISKPFLKPYLLRTHFV